MSLLACVVGVGDSKVATGPSEKAELADAGGSPSEGACDVAGVSLSDGAATVDVSEGSPSLSSSAISSAIVLEGRATASFATCKFCLLLRRLEARGGNDALLSGVEYHGNYVKSVLNSIVAASILTSG